MITYLLLRNNKESGPYSLNELLQYQLKPYDLVWVNGKSAAWRYPSEIEELKQYAPAVEEQPYDRFFKKPSETKQELPSIPAKEESYKPVPESTPSPAFTPKKSVYVTLPGQKTATSQPKMEEIPTPHPPAKKQEPIPIEETISITENPVAAEIKYSQPLDEIKQMYVKTLQDRKQRIANRTFLVQTLKKAAVVLAIVGAGILIGLTLNSRSAKQDTIAEDRPVSTTNPASTVPSTPEETTLPVDGLNAESNTAEQYDQSLTSEKQQTEPLFREPDQQQSSPVTSERKALPSVQKPQVTERKEWDPDQVSPGVDVNASTGERSRKMRTAIETYEESELVETKKPQPKAQLKSNELSKLVTVSSNEYQRVAFGGIRNLQLTVNNESKYIIDQVTVELQYLKPSEQPLKTENIQFRSIAPGGSLTIRVPDTNRGIKVLYRITNVLSTQAAKETAGL